MASVLQLDVSLDGTNLKDGLFWILAHVRQEWDKEKINFKTMPSFLSCNQNTICYTTDDMTQAVMVRVYGGRRDTQQELEATILLHEISASAPLLCTFKNGVCHEFVHGNTCNWSDIDSFKEAKLARAVARELAKLHMRRTLDLAANKRGIKKDYVVPFGVLHAMLQHWPINSQDQEINAMVSSQFPSVEALQKEAEFLMKMLTDEGIPIVFGHNDANPTNVIYNRTKDKVTLVDFEVCGMSPETYDLSSFLESSAIGMFPDVDARRHSVEFQKDFLREYIKEKRKLDGVADDVTDEEVEGLYVKTTKTALMVYFISAIAFVTVGANPMPNSFIQGKDLIGLGLTRYIWYQSHKDEITAMKAPVGPTKS